MKVGSEAERNASLVLELHVRDLARSVDFYTAFGFITERVADGFAALRWRDGWLFLTCEGAAPTNYGQARTNLRVAVADVEAVWSACLERGVCVVEPIADRPYGLRDFTVRDPDGFALRFAAPP